MVRDKTWDTRQDMGYDVIFDMRSFLPMFRIKSYWSWSELVHICHKTWGEECCSNPKAFSELLICVLKVFGKRFWVLIYFVFNVYKNCFFVYFLLGLYKSKVKIELQLISLMNWCEISVIYLTRRMSEQVSTLVDNNLTSIDASNASNDSFINSSYLIENLLKIIREKHNKPISTEELLKNILIICCYSVIVMVSLTGNLLVVKVIVFGKRKMYTTTNIFIASLAFSDLVMTVFNIPFNVSRLLLESWPFGSFLCVCVPFVQVTCVYVSTFTMTVIAYHRWWTLRRTTASKSLSSIQLSLIIGSVWFFAALLSVPHSVFNKTIIIPTIKDLVRCHVDYPDIEFNFPLWLSVEAFATQYLIPLSITLWLYIKIGYIVSKQGTIAAQSNDHRKRTKSEARKRRIIMLALVVTAFAICWSVYIMLRQ